MICCFALCRYTIIPTECFDLFRYSAGALAPHSVIHRYVHTYVCISFNQLHLNKALRDHPRLVITMFFFADFFDVFNLLIFLFYLKFIFCINLFLSSVYQQIFSSLYNACMFVFLLTETLAVKNIKASGNLIENNLRYLLNETINF